jgi:single-stranded DNA-binding protein
MENYVFENNKVTLVGEVATDFSFNHEVFGEGFYLFELAVRRTSGYVDYIPVMVSERLLDISKDIRGSFVCVNGQFRSFNKHEETRSKLVLTVFAREIEVLENKDYEEVNNVFLDGFVCRQPIHRKTPFGREITDLLLAVNRGYGKSDYIPCVLWGRNAKYGATFEVGTEVQVVGRLQSRTYTKVISETESEERVAYEISVGKIEVQED